MGAHGGQGVLDGEPGALDVDGEAAVIGFFGEHVGGGVAQGDAGTNVVMHDVEAPVRLDHGFDYAAHGVFAGGVGLHRGRTA